MPEPLQLFRIKWCQCPTAYHTKQVSFVEATDADAARALLRDHVERKLGIEWFVVETPEPYTPPTGGRVLD